LEGLDHPTRLVVVKAEVHAKRTRKGYVPSSGQMMFLCPDLALAAELISILYRYRWTIETFFKFIKQLLGCRHLLSQRQTGMEIQVYCAVIVCMLLNLSTGLKPAKAVMELITWYLLGFADVEDVERQIAKTRQEQEARANKRGR
jgi:IS4 transposase